ncbi:hypothetical protein [Marinicella litoralis]|uniref:Uncharacterized protein n=1 Tax=Marinicella litoralis TaxID=644220 RepID=A0A4R6XTP6_9GAMM|nr:hypothetical protein [Marinicella litoralis]TDR23146.1 hypothetical protein C8D91_0003 [Marinicella litoralis]
MTKAFRKHGNICREATPTPKESGNVDVNGATQTRIKMIDEGTDVEPIFIKSLSFGYSLIKRDGDEPVYEIWLGSNSMRDFVHRFDSYDDTVKYMVTNSHCLDYNDAVRLLNKGVQHA